MTKLDYRESYDIIEDALKNGFATQCCRINGTYSVNPVIETGHPAVKFIFYRNSDVFRSVNSVREAMNHMSYIASFDQWYVTQHNSLQDCIKRELGANQMPAPATQQSTELKMVVNQSMLNATSGPSACRRYTTDNRLRENMRRVMEALHTSTHNNLFDALKFIDHNMALIASINVTFAPSRHDDDVFVVYSTNDIFVSNAGYTEMLVEINGDTIFIHFSEYPALS